MTRAAETARIGTALDPVEAHITLTLHRDATGRLVFSVGPKAVARIVLADGEELTGWVSGAQVSYFEEDREASITVTMPWLDTAGVGKR